MSKRQSTIERQTSETKVKVELDIEGQGNAVIKTGIGMYDHLLSLMAKHGLFDLKIDVQGDVGVDAHHTVEDVAIVLGQAFARALGERRGIVRMGHAVVPMDEALALVAVDLGGRGYAAVEAAFQGEKIGELPTDLIPHFFQSLAFEARMNVHARILSGANDHHIAEALLKALGRAMDQATQIDPRIAREIPSTKGVIDA